MAGYILSKMADADLVAIYTYTLEEWGIEQFQIYREHINQALAQIVQQPFKHPAKSRDDLAPGCWLYPVEHHYIVYRQGPDCIEVGRILHERMYFEKQVDAESFET